MYTSQINSNVSNISNSNCIYQQVNIAVFKKHVYPTDKNKISTVSSRRLLCASVLKYCTASTPQIQLTLRINDKYVANTQYFSIKRLQIKLNTKLTGLLWRCQCDAKTTPTSALPIEFPLLSNMLQLVQSLNG